MSLLISTVNSALGNGILHLTETTNTEIELSDNPLPSTILHSSFADSIGIQQIYAYQIATNTTSSYGSYNLFNKSVQHIWVDIGANSALTTITSSRYAYVVYVYNSSIKKGLFLSNYSADLVHHYPDPNYSKGVAASNKQGDTIFLSQVYMIKGVPAATCEYKFGYRVDRDGADFFVTPSANTLYFVQTNIIQGTGSFYYMPPATFSTDIFVDNANIVINGTNIASYKYLFFGTSYSNYPFISGNSVPSTHDSNNYAPSNTWLKVNGASINNTTINSTELGNTYLATLDNRDLPSFLIKSGSYTRAYKIHTTASFQSFVVQNSSNPLILIMTTTAPNYDKPLVLFLPYASLTSISNGSRIYESYNYGNLRSYITININGNTVSFYSPIAFSVWTTSLTVLEFRK